MSGYRFQAIGGTYKARSQAGWHMGSTDAFQSLVGRLIGSVHIAYERMGFVQPGGMLRRVPWEATATYMRQRYARNTGRVDGRGKKRPFPPPPHRSDTGVPHNFSPSSPQFCTLTNSKD